MKSFPFLSQGRKAGGWRCRSVLHRRHLNRLQRIIGRYSLMQHYSSFLKNNIHIEKSVRVLGSFKILYSTLSLLLFFLIWLQGLYAVKTTFVLCKQPIFASNSLCYSDLICWWHNLSCNPTEIYYINNIFSRLFSSEPHRSKLVIFRFSKATDNSITFLV